MKLFTCVAALVTALLMTHSASAAAPLGKACAAEIKAQCADVKPGGGRIRDCLKAMRPSSATAARKRWRRPKRATRAARRSRAGQGHDLDHREGPTRATLAGAGARGPA